MVTVIGLVKKESVREIKKKKGTASLNVVNSISKI